MGCLEAITKKLTSPLPCGEGPGGEASFCPHSFLPLSLAVSCFFYNFVTKLETYANQQISCCQYARCTVGTHREHRGA